MGRDNGHSMSTLALLFPGRGPFCSYASAMTLQELSKMPVGLQFFGTLAEPLPLLRSELGKDVVITIKAQRLKGKAGTEQRSPCTLYLQGRDCNLLVCVASWTGLNYD